MAPVDPLTAEQFCAVCGFDAVSCRCDESEDEMDDFPDDEPDDESENCSGWFEEGSGRFVCGAVGSEDCDSCPHYDWLGKTVEEVDAEEMP